MRSRLSRSVGLASLAMSLAAVLSGCPGDDPEVCRDEATPAGFDPTTPEVSFARDVFPIFGRSCAFTTCHGSAAGGANGVFLGGQDPARVHTALVEVRSSQLPTMAFVSPGDPAQSWLQRKIDGSHCAFEAECLDGDCGGSMPRNEGLLPADTRDAVRRWIAQGARND
jgi:hypothetical protein